MIFFEKCNDPEIIDLGVLANWTGNNPGRLTVYCNRFLETATKTLSEMQAAIQEENLRTLAQLGHRLKSVAFTMGAMRFGNMCETLEKIESEGDLTSAKLVIAELSELFVNIKINLASLDLDNEKKPYKNTAWQ